MKRFLIFLLLAFSLISNACSKPTEPSSTFTITQTADTPYTISTIPTPSPEKCVVTGVLMQNPGPSPVTRTVLMLGGILYSNGTPAFARTNQNDIRTLTDDNGRFVFGDVPCQEYSLVLDKITEAILLTNPDTGQDLLFTPQAGQILDLGELVYSDLPLPTQTK